MPNNTIPRTILSPKAREEVIAKVAAEYDRLEHAIDLLAEGKVPEWMKPRAKKAYALGIITDTDLVICPQCNGTGTEPDEHWNSCMGDCRGDGYWLTPEAIERIDRDLS